jgi:hypothetical protein
VARPDDSSTAWKAVSGAVPCATLLLAGLASVLGIGGGTGGGVAASGAIGAITGRTGPAARVASSLRRTFANMVSLAWAAASPAGAGSVSVGGSAVGSTLARGLAAGATIAAGGGTAAGSAGAAVVSATAAAGLGCALERCKALMAASNVKPCAFRIVAALLLPSPIIAASTTAPLISRRRLWRAAAAA